MVSKVLKVNFSFTSWPNGHCIDHIKRNFSDNSWYLNFREKITLRIFQFVSFSPVRQNLPTQMSLKCDCKSVPQNCSFAVFTLIFIEMFQVLDLKVLFFWHVFNGTFERFFSFTRGAEEERWNEGSNCTDWFLQITSREYQNGGQKRNF